MREILLILHFIGLVMGLGTSFAFMFLGMASSKLPKDEARKFSIHAFALSKMGHIGLTLLVVTGILLMEPYWATLFDNPLLLAKLFLVLVLAALIGIISATSKKAKAGDFEKHMKKMAPLGRLSMLVGITIVVLAVYLFY